MAVFRQKADGPVSEVERQKLTPEQKARAVNSIINTIKVELVGSLQTANDAARQTGGMVVQYCYSVASLEYRHKVWPYEYMAFSRRVGELWEQFCSAAWDFPTRPNVIRMPAPSFSDVSRVLLNRLTSNLGSHANKDVLLSDIKILFDIIGEINMNEDEVFKVDTIPHVVDFKSGFGSNEKGNMLRLKTVGEAYRIWNHKTRLLLLVRQDANNNYLQVLKRMGLWEVFTGDAAYKEIEALTGANVNWVRTKVIDWPNDLSPEFHHFLQNQHRDLTSYLAW